MLTRASSRPIVRLPRHLLERPKPVRRAGQSLLKAVLLSALLLAGVFYCYVAAAAGQSSANFSIPRDTINLGVGGMSSAGFSISSSLGDSVAGGNIGSAGFQLSGGFRAANVPPAVLNLLSVFSRKLHAGVPFDLVIDRGQPITGAVSVEPRASGAGGSGHTIVFRFDNPITAEGAATALDAAMNAAATVTLSRAGNDVIATLANVTDSKRLTLKLSGINGTTAVEASIGFLLGDVTQSRAVNAADLAAIKANIGKTLTNSSIARFDLNADGSITQTDLAAAKARSGQVLP